MFEAEGGVLSAVLPTEELAEMTARLARLDTAVDDGERVEQLRALEVLKAAAAAAQARVSAAFVVSQCAGQRAAGMPGERVGRGVAAQVGLARRESPARAARSTGWAQVLVAELPATLAALTRGDICEWRAMIVARETGWLSREHRAAVDAALAGRLPGLGDRGVEAEAKTLAYRLDPQGYLARVAAIQADRRVSVRPAPDAMARLSALLPAGQGVAAYAALARGAEQARAAGDARGRGQLMADLLTERLTGQTRPDTVPVEINLLMTDTTLFTLPDPASGTAPDAGESDPGTPESDPGTPHREPAGLDEPAQLLGYGPIPAGLARRLVHGADEAARVWVRRLYTRPDTGALVGMDSTRRCFPAGLRQFLVLRDRTCRTPWCDAPIRHADHVVPADEGGPTSAGNGQGLCEACNHAKQAPGWQATPAPGGAGHAVTITTPTGHAYLSRPPHPPGPTPHPHRDQARPPQRADPPSREALPAA